jgi:hypothetical protein
MSMMIKDTKIIGLLEGIEICGLYHACEILVV